MGQGEERVQSCTCGAILHPCIAVQTQATATQVRWFVSSKAVVLSWCAVQCSAQTVYIVNAKGCTCLQACCKCNFALRIWPVTCPHAFVHFNFSFVQFPCCCCHFVPMSSLHCLHVQFNHLPYYFAPLVIAVKNSR